MYKIIAFLLIIVSFSCHKEQPGSELHGIVFTTEGNKVNNAKVSLIGTGTTNITNSEGTYQFYNVNPGEYTVSVEVGIDSASQDIFLPNNEVKILDFNIEDSRSIYTGTYKGIYKVYFNSNDTSDNAVFTELEYNEVTKCDTASNKIIIMNRLAYFIKGRRFGSAIQNGVLIETCGSIIGQFNADSIYFKYNHATCVGYSEYWGKKID